MPEFSSSLTIIKFRIVTSGKATAEQIFPSNDAKKDEQQIQSEPKRAEAKAKEAKEKHYLAEISDREWKPSLSRQSLGQTVILGAASVAAALF